MIMCLLFQTEPHIPLAEVSRVRTVENLEGILQM